MALNFSRYSGEIVPGGAKIDTASIQDSAITAATIASSAVTTAKIASGAVTGAKSSLTFNYPMLVVSSTGTVAAYPFGSSTAPVGGTVTGFFTIQAAAAESTITLWATTAGTIATINCTNTTVGTTQGTAVLNATIASGDTVKIYGAAATGTVTAFVTFKTVN